MMEKTFANFLSEQSTEIDDVDKHSEPPVLKCSDEYSADQRKWMVRQNVSGRYTGVDISRNWNIKEALFRK